MDGLLKGKNAVITGASRGIGYATLRLFIDYGANVWAMTRDCSSLDGNGLVVPDGQWVEPVELDLSDAESINLAVKSVRSKKMPVDILVNNAGIMDTVLSQMTTGESVERQLQVNFVGAFQLTQQISKMMLRAKSGSIVNFSSCVALDSTSGKSAYAASKAAVIGWTRSIAKEFGPYGIRVNCVAPSAVETGLLEGTSAEAIQEVVGASALGRIARPEEVASVVAFLASDLSSYVSSQVIRIDGGM